MYTLVVLEAFGCPFIEADVVHVIRKKDITKKFLRKILNKLQTSNAATPNEFFEKHKICFLADQSMYQKFLLALREEAKNL